MKLPLKNLNLSPYPLHLTNTYTYKVTIVSNVCGGGLATQLILPKCDPLLITENKEKGVLE